jgi:hypothetical protein
MISHHLLVGRVIVPYGGNLYHVVKDLRQTEFGEGNTRSFTSYIQAMRGSDLSVLPGTPGYLPIHTKTNNISTSS